MTYIRNGDLANIAVSIVERSPGTPNVDTSSVEMAILRQFNRRPITTSSNTTGPNRAQRRAADRAARR